MSKLFISIQEAAEISKKSIQTIRRAIKAKKIRFKKQKTPQGFNYLINTEFLYNFYNIPVSSKEAKIKKISKSSKKVKKITAKKSGEPIIVEADDFKTFTAVMEKFLSQHSEERQNFLRLINTLQERLFVLENQLNLLKEPIGKSWYQFWK